MVKRILVEDCFRCPYAKEGHNDIICTKSKLFSGFTGIEMGINGQVLDNYPVIPTWCPLEDHKL